MKNLITATKSWSAPRTKVTTLVVAISSMFCLHTAQASWILIDNFQTYDTGEVRAGSGDDVTGGTWVTFGPTDDTASIEADNGLKYLSASHTENATRGATHELNSDFHIAPEGGTHTFFSRFRYEAGAANSHIVLSGGAITNTTGGNADFGAFGPHVRIRPGTNGDVTAHGDSGASPVDTEDFAVLQDEWVNVWMVVHRTESGDTWDLYMTKGDNSATSANLLAGGVDFRNSISGSITNISLLQGADGSGAAHLNDVYYHSGAELSIIPEPSTYALMGGLMALGLVAFRRRVIK